MSAPINIILIDRNSLFRIGLGIMLNNTKAFNVLSSHESIDSISNKDLLVSNIVIQNLSNDFKYQKSHTDSAKHLDLKKTVFLVNDEQLGKLHSSHLISIDSEPLDVLSCIKSIHHKNMN